MRDDAFVVAPPESPEWSSENLAKTPEREGEKQCGPDAEQGEELGPDDVEARAAEHNRLRQHDELSVRGGQHDVLNDIRHAFPRRRRPGQELHGEQRENEKQRELRHGFGQGRQGDPHRSRGVELQRGGEHEEMDGAMDRHLQGRLAPPPSATGTLTIQTTNPIDQILLTMISFGVTGITSKCSTVPCSRSRMSAAPASTTDSMVICAMRLVIAPNHTLSSWD